MSTTSDIRHATSDIIHKEYGYQGKYSEKDQESGFNSFELRQWDARVGRWMVTDPYGQYHSPYLGMGNNPVNRVDPTGGKDNMFFARQRAWNDMVRNISAWLSNMYENWLGVSRGQLLADMLSGDIAGQIDAVYEATHGGGDGDVFGAGMANETTPTSSVSTGETGVPNTIIETKDLPPYGPSQTADYAVGAYVENNLGKWQYLGNSKWADLSAAVVDFYGVLTFSISVMDDGAAFTWPQIGIVQSPTASWHLKFHELGHVLQWLKWGPEFYEEKVVPASLKSYKDWKAGKIGDHYSTWTEWSADRLAYNYFGKPAWWNTNLYPIFPNEFRNGTWNPYSNGPIDFLLNWFK